MWWWWVQRVKTVTAPALGSAGDGDSEGEVEMFQGLGFIILSFIFEKNFIDHQSSLELKNVVYFYK